MLDIFPITRRWPPTRPGAIQLYSRPTPNGIKVSAMLEECGVEYEAHSVSFAKGEQKTEEFLSLNPNNKIPAIIDPDGPRGQPIELFETGAILIYLAEKTGRFLPDDPVTRIHTIQWLMWQMGGVGPMFGQFGYFHRAGAQNWDDTRAWERYRTETQRLLRVLDGHLAGKAFMMGDEYSIADIAIWPWVRTLTATYVAAEVLGLAKFAEVSRWFDTCACRPANQAAINIPPRE